jgi:membrane protease YdiL (CAAX protease family)
MIWHGQVSHPPQHSLLENLMQNRKTILLISSLLMVPITFIWIQLTTSSLGAKWGYVTGLAGYWVYCLATAWLVSGGSMAYFKSLWNNRNSGKYATWISLAAFIPVLGLFFVSFLPNAAQLTLSTGVLLIVVVLLNGSVEELYWRGLYLLEYPDNTRIGFLFSWLLFGAWHISLWFAKGVIYKDGFLALVGGAYGLGLLWTWVARSNGNLKTVTLSHILVNLFAFTALFVDNGF